MKFGQVAASAGRSNETRKLSFVDDRLDFLDQIVRKVAKPGFESPSQYIGAPSRVASRVFSARRLPYLSETVSSTVKVEYPLHWLNGHEVTVVRCHGNGQLLVETPNGRLCVPTWMTDRTACALLTFGWQPFVCDQALLQLDALLTAID